MNKDMYIKWLSTEIEWLSTEVVNLREQLKLACQYLAEGKRKFAPGTTNSDVDVFLDKHKDI